jgi:tellurite resistance protein TehA-like permease
MRSLPPIWDSPVLGLVALHAANLCVFLASLALAISDNVSAAIIAAIASLVNTILILRGTRHVKETKQDLQARRLVVVKYGGPDEDDETVVITPEERRALDRLRDE